MKNLIKNVALLLGVCVLFSFAEAHDFYTSMTKVDYNSGSKQLKMNIKLDAQHIEKALGVSINDAKFDDEMTDYLNKNFKIKVNDSPVSISYEKKSQSGEVLWIYFNVANVNTVESIEITNTLLFNTFPQQQNFVSLFINNKRENFTCKKGTETGKATF